MKTPTERFDANFETVSTYQKPIDLTEAYGVADLGFEVSIAAGEDFDMNDKVVVGAKALGLRFVERFNDSKLGTLASSIRLKLPKPFTSYAYIFPNLS